MTQLTDEELRQEIQELVKAKRAEERSLITPYDDPREFGRRVAREAFEKYVKGSDSQTSSESPTD